MKTTTRTKTIRILFTRDGKPVAAWVFDYCCHELRKSGFVYVGNEAWSLRDDLDPADMDVNTLWQVARELHADLTISQ